MDKVLQYVIAKTEVTVTFAVSAQDAVIDNCMYCPYRSRGGGYCYLYQRSMADEHKTRPFFCDLAFCEVCPETQTTVKDIAEKNWAKGAF